MIQAQIKTKLTAMEAARHLHITPAALEQRRRRKMPPTYYRIGRKILYDESELDVFLQGCKVTPADDRGKSAATGK